MAPKAVRIEAWNRLARDLDKTKLNALTVTRPMADVMALAPEILAGNVRGRVVLEIGTDVPGLAGHGSATNTGICRVVFAWYSA